MPDMFIIPTLAQLPAWFVIAVGGLVGLLAGSLPMLDRAMMGDVADAIRLEQGKRRIGQLFAMITTAPLGSPKAPPGN